MKAVEFSEFGIPHAVCHCVDFEGVGDPADDEIVVDIEASPINPADLLIVQGKYPGPSELPARLGIEGVGRITAVGKGVKTLAVGDPKSRASDQGTCRSGSFAAGDAESKPADGVVDAT
jgi:trans-2-enoyl-CoA reductase